MEDNACLHEKGRDKLKVMRNRSGTAECQSDVKLVYFIAIYHINDKAIFLFVKKVVIT